MADQDNYGFYSTGLNGGKCYLETKTKNSLLHSYYGVFVFNVSTV